MSLIDRIENTSLVRLLKETGNRWSALEGSTRSSALAHYALFSLFPALLFAVTVVGFIAGDDPAMRERLLAPLARGMTPDLKKMIDDTLDAMQKSESRGIAAAVAIVGLLWSGTGALTELDLTLRKTFDVAPPNTDTTAAWIKSFLRDRLSGVVILLGIGGLVIASTTSDVALRVVERYAPVHVKGAWILLHIVVSIALEACAFAWLFVSRSGHRLGFRAVLPGAFVTSVGLHLLERTLSFYLSKFTSFGAYGVAGAVLALATWITLACTLVLFGAQLTEVLAEHAQKKAEKRSAARSSSGRPPAPPTQMDPRALGIVR